MAEIAATQNTNWADEIFRTGTTQSYELNVAGGTDATRFYLSGQYFDQDAIVPGSYLRRSTLRANLEHKIKDVVKIGFNSSAGISKEGLLRTDRNALNRSTIYLMLILMMLLITKMVATILI